MVKEITYNLAQKVIRSFHTEDVFWNSEVAGNRLVGKSMLLCTCMIVASWALNMVGVYNLPQSVMNETTIHALLELLIPWAICRHFKGEKRWLKYLLLIELTVVLARLDGILTFSTPLLMIVPVLLSVRYYSRPLTAQIAVLSTLCFGLAAVAATFWKMGMVDVNFVTMQEGIFVPVADGDIANAVIEYGFDWGVYTKNYMLHCFLPKLMLFSILASICAEIAYRGHQMVLQQAKISSESARFESELNMATEIQAGMLPCIFPAFPEHKEVDVYATMNPAKEVGGDFYDYFQIDNDHIGVVMADVSGKGVPAALFMMIAKTLIKNETQCGTAPADVFTKVNNQLCDGNEADLFVTAWLGVLEISTQKLTFVNAGHNPPLLCRKGGKFEFIRDRHGLVLAGIEDSQYTQSELTMEQGDILYLYTDGVTEATDTNLEMYGEERLTEYLNAHSTEDVHDLLHGLKNDIDTFVGDAQQFDDITMLVMRLEQSDNKK